MTIEEFFKTFGIEPKRIEIAVGKGFYIEHYTEETYPEITDRILLELICILGTIHLNVILYGTTIRQLKDYILNECIENRKYISEQVQNLFEVEE